MKITKKTAEEVLALELEKRNILFEPQYRFAAALVEKKNLRANLKAAGLHDWRLDFAFIEQKVFIEIQGHGFGHSGKGAIRDWQKHNALVLRGWRGLYYPAFTAQDRPDIIIEDLEKLL